MKLSDLDPVERWPVLHWSHNDHYHPFLLLQVPNASARALDVGCGTGTFARELAKRVGSVDAIDVSDEMVCVAREQSVGIDNVSYASTGLFEFDPHPGGYDFISCIAAIHHMPFGDAAMRLREMLAPGGVLAILGLYRLGTKREYAAAIAVAPLNVLIGVGFAAARGWTPSSLHGMPLRDPDMTLAEIADEAKRVLPGGVIKRHLFWRYSLVYGRPASAA